MSVVSTILLCFLIVGLIAYSFLSLRYYRNKLNEQLNEQKEKEKAMYLYDNLQDKQIIYGHDVPIDIAERKAFTWIEDEIERGWLGLNKYCDKNWTYPLDDNIKLEINKEIFPFNPDVITINVVNVPDDAIIDTIYLNWYIEGEKIYLDNKGNTEILKCSKFPDWEKAITRLIQLYGKDEGTHQLLIDNLVNYYNNKMNAEPQQMFEIEKEVAVEGEARFNAIMFNDNKPFTDRTMEAFCQALSLQQLKAVKRDRDTGFVTVIEDGWEIRDVDCVPEVYVGYGEEGEIDEWYGKLPEGADEIIFDYDHSDDIDNDYDYKYSEGGSNPGAFAEDDIPVYDLVPEGTIINGHVVRRPAS